MQKILRLSDLRLATYSEYQTLARSTVRDPVFLLLLSIAWISVQFGFTAVPFQQQSFLVNQIVLGGFLLLYLCAKYYWLAAWFHRGTALGVPLILIYLAFYTTAHICFHLIFGPLVFDDDFARPWQRFWRTYAIAVPLTVSYAFSFLPRASLIIYGDGTAQARPAAQTPEQPPSAPRVVYIGSVLGRVLQALIIFLKRNRAALCRRNSTKARLQNAEPTAKNERRHVLRPDPILTQNTADVGQLRIAMRRYLSHPVPLLVLFVPLFQRFLGQYPPEFPHLGLVWDSIFYTAKIFFYIAVAIAFQPYVQRWFLIRNLSFTLCTFVFFIFFLLLNFIIFHLYLLAVPTEGFDVLSLRLVRQVAFAIFVHFIVCLAIEQRVRPLLGADPRLVPYFWPVPKALRQGPAAVLLDDELYGDVIAMNAQNQYVAVYRVDGAEPELLRITLSAAMARLPANSGLQVHRSWWVSQRALLNAQFDPKALQIINEKASSQVLRSIPVGKTFAVKLQAHFDASHASRNPKYTNV